MCRKKIAQAFCRLSLVRRNAAHSTHECEYFLLAVSASLLFFRLFFPSFTTHGVSLLLLLLVKFFLSDPLSSHIHFPLFSFLLSLLPPQQIVRMHVPIHTHTHTHLVLAAFKSTDCSRCDDKNDIQLVTFQIFL